MCVYVVLASVYLDFVVGVFYFFKQKTAYEMRISDWSSDVCSSDLAAIFPLDGDTALAGTATIAGETFGRITRISLGVPGVDFEGSTFGHVFILNDDVQSIWDTIRNSMVGWTGETGLNRDRKSTRLNSSH